MSGVAYMQDAVVLNADYLDLNNPIQAGKKSNGRTKRQE
jgi:hypothetical protein